MNDTGMPATGDSLRSYLQQAQAFDARFGPSPAPQRTKMEQNGTSGAKQAKAVDAALAAPDIPLQWTKVEQNGTRGAQQKCAAAVDAALAGVRERIAAGANVNAGRKDKHPPLEIAARRGHLTIVRDLIVHGANVNQICP